MRIINCWAIAAVTFLGATSFCAGQTVLKYKFEEGQKIDYSIKQELSLVMEISGQITQIKMDQDLDTVWEVKKVSDGLATVIQRITRAKIKTEGPNIKIEYDTKGGKEPDDALGKKLVVLYKALVGADISLKISQQGAISDVKVPKELLDVLAKDPFLAQIGGSAFTEAGIKQSAAQSMILFPAKGLTKNDTWKGDPIEVKNNGVDAKMVAADTFEGLTTIDGKEFGKFTRKVTMEMKPNQPVEMKIKSQDTAGTILFDVAAGQIASSDVSQKMNMVVSQQGVTVTIIIDQTVKMKRGK